MTPSSQANILSNTEFLNLKGLDPIWSQCQCQLCLYSTFIVASGQPECFTVRFIVTIKQLQKHKTIKAIKAYRMP